MRKSFVILLRKDFRLCLHGRFFLLALGSLILYSCYINLVYVKLDQEIFPVYRYDPLKVQGEQTAGITDVGSLEELEAACGDGYSAGLYLSGDRLPGGKPEIMMVSSGVEKIDRIREAYARSMLFKENSSCASETDSGSFLRRAKIIGENGREMKNRREITAEFLFFELAAVGFLGLAAMLFKEKQMGVIRVHAVLPVSRVWFILSKLAVILLSDLLFAGLLTVINLGLGEGFRALPGVLLQTGILSLVMALTGFFCAVVLPDFKQFSLIYLVLAVFITTPVFLAGQTGVEMDWMRFHPMYHLFMAMKNAYFQMPPAKIPYYGACAAAIILLFLAAVRGLGREMEREG